jgi:rubrerythrin
MWVEQHTASAKDYMRSGIVFNQHHQTTTAASPTPAHVIFQPEAESKPKPTWQMTVKPEMDTTRQIVKSDTPKALTLLQSMYFGKHKTEQLDTPTRFRIAVLKCQAEDMMRCLKNPETNKQFWSCTECDYFSKAGKNAKSNVKSHVWMCHIDSSDTEWKNNTWTHGQGSAGTGTPTLPTVKSPNSDMSSQVESMMTKMHDAATSCTIWLCTECNYSQAMSATSKSKSHKDKMKRHIMRKHIEGGKASLPMPWPSKSAKAQAMQQQCQY